MTSSAAAPVGRWARPEARAAADPGKVAIVDGERELTYAEWNRRANRLADYLDRHICGQGIAAVRTHMRAEWFVINLALAKLDWYQVAVNWRLSAPEVRHVLADSGATVYFFDDPDPLPGEALCAELGIAAVPLAPGGRSADLATAIARGEEVERFSRRRARPVIYTSGTTGRPRGVAKNTDDGAGASAETKAYLRSRRDRYPGTDADRTLITLPLHHGAGEGNAQRALSAGGTIHLLDRFDAVRALEIIERHRITQWCVVPTMLHRIRALSPEVLGRFDAKSLRHLEVTGAAAPQPLKEWAIEFFGEGKLYEAYGATEVGTIAMMPPELHRERPGSCGLPLDHVDVRVVAEQGRMAPRGVEGELQVRTPLTIGRYLSGPDLDGDVVTADGYFRLGDVGKIDDDGFLYVTGRIKDMIICGGVNIYPAEVERVLLTHPDVIDAAVVGAPDEEMGERVVAHCEVRPGSALTPESLLAQVSDKLAVFKRPRAVHFVDSLPRNGMEKVLKEQIRRWVAVGAEGECRECPV